MNYLILFPLIIIAVEVIIKSNYTNLLKSVLKLLKKATFVISKKSISDHWKEKIIPEYSFRIMKYSLSMFFTLLLIFFLFLIVGFLSSEFLKFIFSLKALLASTLFAFTYLYLKKLIISK